MMKVRVVVVLSDTILRAGLLSILRDFFPSVDALALPLSELEGGDEDCIYVTDSQNYVSAHDLFSADNCRCGVLTSAGQYMVNSRSNLTLINTSSGLDQIIDALNTLISRSVTTELSHQTGSNELSAREIQVLTLVVSGSINKEIAAELAISVNTVLTHRKNITAKLGIKTVSGLTLYALMHGYIKG